jgi:hypothetical protein
MVSGKWKLMRNFFLLLSIAAAVGLALWIPYEWHRGNDRFIRSPEIHSTQNFFPGNPDQDKAVRAAFTADNSTIDQTYLISASEFWWGKMLGWITGAITVVLTFYASWRSQGSTGTNQSAPQQEMPSPQPPPSHGQHRRTYLVIASLALIGSLTNFASMAFKAEAQDQVAKAEWMEEKLDSLKKQAADPGADSVTFPALWMPMSSTISTETAASASSKPARSSRRSAYQI